MKFQQSDAGRAQSKRPKQKSDCVVRALALAFETDYDSMYDTMAELGRKSGRGTDKELWQRYLYPRAEKKSFPAIAGKKRMNLKTFVEKNPNGSFVVQMAGHVTFVRDGVVMDDSPPREMGCVYASWQVFNTTPGKAGTARSTIDGGAKSELTGKEAGKVIHRGKLKQFVGIGWIEIDGKPDPDKYPILS